MNTVILTKFKVKSKNDVALSARDSNNQRGDVIRLCDLYVCDDSHDEILHTNSQGENWIAMNLFCKEKYKSEMMIVNTTKIYFSYDITNCD